MPLIPLRLPLESATNGAVFLEMLAYIPIDL